MAAPHGQVHPAQYFPYPASVIGLNPEERAGLHAISALATLSAVCTSGLLSFLLYRAIYWERYYTTTLTRNQNIVLLSNLLFADLIQAIGFLFSAYWVNIDSILAPTPACTAQGILLNLGDVASGSFVFLISIHTAVSVLRGPSIPLRYLLAAIATCWIFAIFLSTIGIAIYSQEYYTAAGIWVSLLQHDTKKSDLTTKQCWVGGKHEHARLWSHYCWIFTFEFGTLIVYVITFIILRSRIVASQSNLRMMNPMSTHNATNTRINRVTYYMIMYPIVYFVCTAPLAIGRMHSMSTGKQNPIWFYILAGCLLLSCGWLDSIVYALTRHVFVRDHNGDRSGGYYRNNDNNNSSYAKGSHIGAAATPRDTLDHPHPLRAMKNAADIDDDDHELLQVASKRMSSTEEEWKKPLAHHSAPPPTTTTIDSISTTTTTKSITSTTASRARSLTRKARGAGFPVSSAGSDNESLIRRPFSAEDERARITVTKDFEVRVHEEGGPGNMI